MRSVLLDLACRSALLRIARRTGSRPITSAAAWETSDQPWFSLSDALREDMTRLGSQLSGTGRDARTSPLWVLLEHKRAYEYAFTPAVHAELKELDPGEIYRGLANGLTLHWGKWEIDPFGPRQASASDGLATTGSRVWVQNPGGVRRTFNGITLATARDIYLHIAYSTPRAPEQRVVSHGSSAAANSPGLAPAQG